MGRIFVKASRRARAHTRSSIARKKKLSSLIVKVERKLARLDPRFGHLAKRRSQLQSLKNSLRARSFEQGVILSAKRQKGYQSMHRNMHGGYNIF